MLLVLGEDGRGASQLKRWNSFETKAHTPAAHSLSEAERRRRTRQETEAMSTSVTRRDCGEGKMSMSK